MKNFKIMNAIDIVLGIIFVIAFFVGFKKGILRVLASLIGLVAAVYGAIAFSDPLKVYLENWFDWSQDLTKIVAFIITFLLITLLFSILGRILTKVADFAMLGIFNKLFGGIFNILKFSFLMSVVFMFVNASENYRILSEEERESSVLYKPVASLAPAILPTIMEEVKGIEMDEMDILDKTIPSESSEEPTEQPVAQPN